MSTYRQLQKAIEAAQRQSETDQEPIAVIEWRSGSTHYLIRKLAKAQTLVAKRPEASIKARFYPGTLDGVS
jgi:hypothetical protein